MITDWCLCIRIQRTIAVVDEEEKRILETQDLSTEDDAFMLLEWASKTMKDINQN